MNRWVDFAGGVMWLDPDASEFEHLMAASRWEWRKVNLLKQYLEPGMLFVDAGAHWGYFGLIAAQLGAEVIAIEPDAGNYSRMTTNFRKNDYPFEGWPVAIWKQADQLELFQGYNSGTHSVVKDYQGTLRRVKAQTLDHILNGRLPGMIKLDVEGADIPALEGATKTFSQAERMVILMDLHPELGVQNETVGQLLNDHGFRLYDIRNNNAPLTHISSTLVELLAIKQVSYGII